MKSRTNTSLFLCFAFTSTIFLLIDDIIITGSNDHEVQELISLLHKQFTLKYIGLLNYFLGVEVTHLRNGDLALSQTKYT